MCGRYSLATTEREMAEAFELRIACEIPKRYNIAPTQAALVVRSAEAAAERSLDPLRWGLIPSWSKDPAIGNRMINARSETVAEKPSYRTAFKRRRCLVPCTGFYEWKKLEPKKARSPKQPYYIHHKDEGVFAMAGLWDCWHDPDGSEVETFTILTTEPSELMKPIHDRMPVVVDPRDYQTWLDPRLEDPHVLLPLLKPYERSLVARPVGTHVNRPGNDDPRCIEAVA